MEVERELQLFALALAQIAGSAPAVSTIPDKIDVTVPQSCDTQNAATSEIVVCAPRADGLGPYRLKQSPDTSRSAIPRAEVTLANGVAVTADMERADVGGFASNRLMAGLKIKF